MPGELDAGPAQGRLHVRLRVFGPPISMVDEARARFAQDGVPDVERRADGGPVIGGGALNVGLLERRVAEDARVTNTVQSAATGSNELVCGHLAVQGREAAKNDILEMRLAGTGDVLVTLREIILRGGVARRDASPIHPCKAAAGQFRRLDLHIPPGSCRGAGNNGYRGGIGRGHHLQ